MFDGVILLGTHSTSDITSLRVLSIYGTNDKVMNHKTYEKNRENIAPYTEKVIIGGNHAYFGMYGEQKGDGTATITNEKQIRTTADYIVQFITQ